MSRGVYFVAREKLTHAAVDQVFNQHDIDFAIGGIKTQLGVNVFLTLGQIEESRNIIRALHTGVANVTFILLAYQFDNEIDARIYTSFNGIGTYLPEAFKETGAYVRETMMELIQKVQTASQKNVVLAGTKTALANIAEGIDANWISQSQKEEMATTGALLNLTGLGVTAIEIPQTFIRGTYDFKVDNKSIYVLPDLEKPIKLYFEGETRAKELSEQQTHDMTIDTQVQTKLGHAVILSSLFGKYTIE